MKLRVALRLTAALTSIALLAACSTASTGTKATTTSGGAKTAVAASLTRYTTLPTTVPINTPLSKKPPTGEKVDYLQNGLKPGQQFSAALQAAVKPLGWTEHDVDYDPSNPATLGSAFLQAINGGANVIEVQGLPGALYARYVPAARAKHIIVVDSISTGKRIPGVLYVARSAAVGKPQATIATAAVEADAKQRGITPHVLKIGSVLYASLITPFMNDVSADLKATCSSCSDALLNLSAQATISNQDAPPIVSYLQVHPDINYIVLFQGATSTGLLQAISAAGLGNKIRIVGCTPLPPQIQDLKSNNPQVLGWIANSIVVSAWMTVDAAARDMVGDSTSQYANSGGPTWLLTHDSGTALVPDPVAPLTYQAQYEKLWHVSSS